MPVADLDSRMEFHYRRLWQSSWQAPRLEMLVALAICSKTSENGTFPTNRVRHERSAVDVKPDLCKTAWLVLVRPKRHLPATVSLVIRHLA